MEVKFKNPKLFWQLIRENKNSRLITVGDLVYVAISGGRDSIFLFYYLLFLREKIDFELRLAHLNHGLRPDVDQLESDYLRTLASKYKLPYEERVIAGALLQESPLGLEAAARKARQDFFEDLRREAYLREDYEPDKIKFALGHQQDDLAESMLLQLSRGTGLNGLIAMRGRDRHFIRPLLGLSRAEISEFLKVEELKYFDDQSNQDSKYLRNALRLQLIPQWSELIGYPIVPQLAKLSRNLSSVAAVVESLIETKLRETLSLDGQILRRRLIRLEPEVQELVLHRYIRGEDYRLAPNSRQMEMILKRLRKGGGKASFDLGANRCLKLLEDRVFLVKE